MQIVFVFFFSTHSVVQENSSDVTLLQEIYRPFLNLHAISDEKEGASSQSSDPKVKACGVMTG